MKIAENRPKSEHEKNIKTLERWAAAKDFTNKRFDKPFREIQYFFNNKNFINPAAELCCEVIYHWNYKVYRFNTITEHRRLSKVAIKQTITLYKIQLGITFRNIVDKLNLPDFKTAIDNYIKMLKSNSKLNRLYKLHEFIVLAKKLFFNCLKKGLKKMKNREYLANGSFFNEIDNEPFEGFIKYWIMKGKLSKNRFENSFLEMEYKLLENRNIPASNLCSKVIDYWNKKVRRFNNKVRPEKRLPSVKKTKTKTMYKIQLAVTYLTIYKYLRLSDFKRIIDNYIFIMENSEWYKIRYDLPGLFVLNKKLFKDCLSENKIVNNKRYFKQRKKTKEEKLHTRIKEFERVMGRKPNEEELMLLRTELRR